MENREENLVKKTCRELGITQKELAEKIGVKPESLNSSLSRGKISNQTKKSLEMLSEINNLSRIIESYNFIEDKILDIVKSKKKITNY
ncbi:Helix-turn-helix protein [Thiovulum sp. ES]|nr:Helix-turn-helix protein [Thiovulum sp. ES]